MTATVAPSPWPTPAARNPWRFGCELDGGRGLRWVLGRNGGLGPRRHLGGWLLLSGLSLGLALFLWWHGVAIAAAFAAAELALLGTLLLLCAHHAADREMLTLADGALVVEHRYGGRTERARFRAAWVRVEPARAQGSLVELSGEGRQIRVGRYLRPELRLQLAQELRRALRTVGLQAAVHQNTAMQHK
ncbi:DUF2244 domain-containing protein [Azohydromonas caseinilytica]|uniref:DUF2244 domain-containing protein n=1 Tax=Azohydromonas caseinilytica TaxID=2728836 RepID=A0A848FA94_9BURK|nr:DUF2244 domain-containing protein [Azohydromonas caseinilytica]NML15130.1 DUF2244 domain-containing protein [Azohydromonas caseinilytica]